MTDDERAEKLAKLIHEGLTNSKANGYFEPGEPFHSASAADIAKDIIAYDDDVMQYAPYDPDGPEPANLWEDYEKEITPIVQDWLDTAGKG